MTLKMSLDLLGGQFLCPPPLGLFVVLMPAQGSTASSALRKDTQLVVDSMLVRRRALLRPGKSGSERI